MKKLFLMTLLICFITNAFGQIAKEKEPETNSKSLRFLQGNGQCIKKEFYDLSKVNGVECKVLILSDVVTMKKMGCLRIETEYYSSYSRSSDSYIGTLDYEELDACIRSLNYIKNNLLNSKPETYTEIEYKTLDNLKIGAFYDNKKGTWSAFVYTKGYTSRSAEFFDASNIDPLIEVFNQAKTMIEEKLK